MNRRYNAHLKKIIELSEGEEFCSKCDGKGVVPKEGKIFACKAILPLICSKCLGDGKIDWVEKVLGKKIKTEVNDLKHDDLIDSVLYII